LGCSVRTLYRRKNGDCPAKPAEIHLLAEIARGRAVRKAAPEPKFKFIDLFAGIGGMRLAAEAAGGRCVFTSEWNSKSRETYEANFGCGPEHPFEGDIRNVPAASIPEFDLLLAGFPCQPFSIAGVSKKNALGRPHGFKCEEQGNLFFEIVRILRHHRPAAFILENVKNLKTHDGGNTFRVIMRELTEKKTAKDLGYSVQTRIINAKGLVPQNRERIFLVGFREPQPFNLADMVVPSADDGPKLRRILHPEDGSEEPEKHYTIGLDAKVAPKYILTEHLWTYLQRYHEKHKAMGHGFGFGLVGPKDSARTLSARYFKDGSEILIRRRRGRPRRLTPRECARLMGFDTKKRTFLIPVSDTQAYKQFGNAVVVPVVERIIRFILPHLIKAIRSTDPLQLEFPLEEQAELRAARG
jgi:DNA (cytosine-5)-methyltransferase 1